jgi:hypothetical protein
MSTGRPCGRSRGAQRASASCRRIPRFRPTLIVHREHADHHPIMQFGAAAPDAGTKAHGRHAVACRSVARCKNRTPSSRDHQRMLAPNIWTIAMCHRVPSSLRYPGHAHGSNDALACSMECRIGTYYHAAQAANGEGRIQRKPRARGGPRLLERATAPVRQQARNAQ